MLQRLPSLFNSKSYLSKLVLLAGVCGLASSAYSQATVYNGPVGGDWFDAGNWNNGVPDATKVVILNGNKVAINNDANAKSIRMGLVGTSLSGIEVTNGTLSLVDDLSITSVVDAFPGARDTSSDFESTNASLVVGRNLHHSWIIGLESGEGDYTSKFSFDTGTMDVTNNVVVGGSELTSPSAAILNLNNTFELSAVSNGSIGRDFRIISNRSSGNATINENLDFDISSASSINVSGDLEAAVMLEFFGGQNNVNLTSDILESNVFVTGNASFGKVDDRATGQADFDLDLLFQNSELDVDGILTFGEIENPDIESQHVIDVEADFESCAVFAGQVTSGFGSTNSTTKSKITLDRTFVEIDKVATSGSGDRILLSLGDGSELVFVASGTTRADISNFDQDDTYSVIDIIDSNVPIKGAELVEATNLGGALSFVYAGSGEDVVIGEEFDLISLPEGEFFSGDFSQFSFSGLPNNLGAEYSFTTDNQNRPVLRVKIVQGSLFYVGEDGGDWDTASNWDLNVIPAHELNVFVNNTNSVLYDSDTGKIEAGKLNIGVNGGSGTLSYDSLNESSFIEVATEFNVGVFTSGSGDSFGSLNLGFNSEALPYLDQGALVSTHDNVPFRVGYTSTDGNATGFIRDDFRLLENDLTENFGIMQMGVSDGNGRAEADVSIPFANLGSVEGLEVGVSNDSGVSVASIEFDDVEVDGSVLIGVSNGSGSATADVNGDDIDGSPSSLDIGVSTSSGPSEANVLIRNINDGPSNINIGVSANNGDAKGELSSFEIDGNADAMMQGDINVGVNFGSGDAEGAWNGNPNQFGSATGIRRFRTLNVGVKNGSGGATGFMSAARGVDIPEINVGIDTTTKGISGGANGTLQLNRGLTTTQDLNLGSGSTVVSSILGSARGSASSSNLGYHAFDTDFASLDGVLILDFGYAPTGNEVYQFVRTTDANGITGDFDDILVSNLNKGLFLFSTIDIEKGVEVYNLRFSGTPEVPTWTNPATGLLAGDWFDQTNWSTNRVPNFGDTASIINGGEAVASNMAPIKGVFGSIEAYTLDVGSNGTVGTLELNGYDATFIHALNIGITSPLVCDSGMDTTGNLVMTGGQIGIDSTTLTTSPNDPTGQNRGINFGLAEGHGLVTSNVDLLDTDLLQFNKLINSNLNVGVAKTTTGNDAEVEADFIFNGIDPNGGPIKGAPIDRSTIDFANMQFGLALGDSENGDVGNASSSVNLEIKNANFGEGTSTSIVEADTNGGANVVESEGKLLFESVDILGNLYLAESDSDSASSATVSLEADFNFTTMYGDVSILDGIDADGEATSSIGTADIEFKQSRFESTGDLEIGSIYTSNGAHSYNQFDILFDQTFIGSSYVHVMDIAVDDQSDLAELDGVMAIEGSTVNTNSMILGDGTENNNGYATSTLKIVFDDTDVDVRDDFEIASHIEATGSSNSRTDVNSTISFLNDTTVQTNNFFISGSNQQMVAELNGRATALVDVMFDESDLMISNDLEMGFVESSDNGRADLLATLELDHATGTVGNNASFGQLNGNSTGLNQAGATLDMIQSSFVVDNTMTLSSPATTAGTPRVNVQMQRSFISTGDLVMNEGAILRMGISGLTRATESNLQKGGGGIPDIYSAIDVAGNVALSGTLDFFSSINQVDPCEELRFTLIDADTVSGSFSEIRLPFSGNWSVEIDQANGDVIAVLSGDTIVNARYRSDGNGTINGITNQNVTCGDDGTTVTAQPNDGYVFVRWSDGSTDNPRQDLNRTQPIDVTAEFEGTIPNVVLSTTNVSPTNNGLIDIKIDFSEPIMNFGTDDLIVTNATQSGPLAQDPTDVTVFNINFLADGDGDVTVQIPADSSNNNAGNGNTASNLITVTFDGTAPSVVLSLDGSGSVSGPFDILADFTEDVSTLEISDIVITNGTIDSLVSESASRYRISITPDGSGPVIVSIGADAVADPAGNGNRESNELSVDFATSDLFIIQ